MRAKRLVYGFLHMFQLLIERESNLLSQYATILLETPDEVRSSDASVRVNFTIFQTIEFVVHRVFDCLLQHFC